MMVSSVRREKQERLITIIKSLSTDNWHEDKAKEYLGKLRAIYSQNYRHDYSIFFPLLTEMQKKSNEFDLQILIQNIGYLRDYIDQNFCNSGGSYDGDDIKQIVKLLDHLNLEVSRIDVNNANIYQIQNLKRELEESKQRLEDVKNKLTDATKKAESLQAEFISILSVFSAVILVFFVDTQLITEAMANMQSSSIFRLILVLSICGLVLFNGLFLLFRFISHLITRNESDNKNKSESKTESNMPIIVLNIVFVALIILDVIAWYLCVTDRMPFNQLYYPIIK